MNEAARRDKHYSLIDWLASRGPDDLSDFQLLTLLFGGCVALSEAESCATEYVEEIGRPTSVQDLDFGELTWIPGIGEAKAAAIIAGVELGRRSAWRGRRPGTPLPAKDTISGISTGGTFN